MSDFEVNIPGLNSRRSDLVSIYGRLVFLKAQLDFCEIGLAGCLTSSGLSNIKRSLSNSSKSLQNQIEHMRKMSTALKQISDTYKRTEKSIVENSAMSAIKEPKKTGNILERLLSGEKISGSLVSGEISGSTEVLGFVASGAIGGGFLNYEAKRTGKFGIEFDENGDVDSAGAYVGAGISGSVLEGHAEGSIGDLSGKVSGEVLSGGLTGEIGATLFKDGKLNPQIGAKVKAEGSVLSGEAEVKKGNDVFNRHAKAEGQLVGGEAKAEVGAGAVTFTDKNGKERTEYGVQAEAGAEGYLAKGEISGGFTILGVNFDVGVEGKAGALGAKAGGRATTGGFEGSIGASLGLGLGFKFSVDWSGFKLPWQ